MATKTIIKHWGSSLGVVIPKELVNKQHLKAREEVILELKRSSIKEAFGSLKQWKIDSQKMKDNLRKEWK